jgi:hypothetical protein
MLALEPHVYYDITYMRTLLPWCSVIKIERKLHSVVHDLLAYVDVQLRGTCG